MPRRKGPVDQDKIRQSLLEAAENMVQAEGPATLTTRKLAEAIGYSLGHIYNLFPDLSHLVLAVNGRTLDRLREKLGAAQGPQRLEQLALIYLRFTAENANLWQLVLGHRLTPGADLPESYRAKISALPALVKEALHELAPHLSEADMKRDVALLWASLHGLGTLSLSHRLDMIDAPSAESLAQRLIQQYRQSLNTR